MSDMENFRQETRKWLDNNCPPMMREPMRSEDDACWGGRNVVFQSDDQRIWLERMAARGWTTPTWPTQYGGGGLNAAQAKILQEEMKRINARRPLSSFGIDMLGPALLKFASEEQKQKFIPDIIHGKIRWCQGYSEPNSGSDLASLATKAEDKGDHYEVTGQKVWTSYADKADWIFCLVRTDFEAPKHKGISFLLFDMESKGVSTSLIKLISGNSPFCETFMDSVKVPKDQLIGEEGTGWTIAKYLLTHEREMIGGIGGLPVPVSKVAMEQSGSVGQLEDGMLRAEIAKHEIDAACFMATMERVKDEAKAGASLGAASSMLKYYGTELNKERLELMLQAKGSDALEWEGQASEEGKLAREWLRSKANSIEGGTSEVQLNIISKRILGLPS